MRPEGFDWDDAKHELNVRKHQLGFDQARRVFEDSMQMTEYDDRFDYGEARYRAWGLLDDKPHCLVLTVRNGTVRAISLRRAHRKELDHHVPKDADRS